jgi:hypothetical protein
LALELNALRAAGSAATAHQQAVIAALSAFLQAWRGLCARDMKDKSPDRSYPPTEKQEAAEATSCDKHHRSARICSTENMKNARKA